MCAATATAVESTTAATTVRTTAATTTVSATAMLRKRGARRAHKRYG
jgi:hypothetical protein